MPAKKKSAAAVYDVPPTDPVVDVSVDNPDPPPAKKTAKKPVKKSPRAVAKKPARPPVDEVSFRDPIEVSSRKIMCLLPDLIGLSQRIIGLGFRADEDEVLGNVSSMLRDVYMDEKKKMKQNAKAKR